jgi:glycerophosphoryl diester phosphodiesterase
VPPTNPWLDRRIIAYAHQGGAWEGPSSTLFAIEQALANGATGIELDVHATADGELVVCHDASVDRTTNGQGTIVSHTLAELRQLDPAYWWIEGADITPDRPAEDYPYRGRAPDDHDFRIATLREVLERFPGVVLNLDIKQTGPVVEPYEATLAQLLNEFERGDDLIVASFLDPATDAFSAVEPNLATSAGTMATAEFWRSVQTGEPPAPMRGVALQVPESFGDQVVVDERFIAAAHQHGIAVHVWTINDTTSMERLVDLGVDGIISDVPTQLVDVLTKHSVAWSSTAGPTS